MLEVRDDVLGEIVQVIVQAVDPDRIIPFGSRAGGDFRQDSDIDLLVADSIPFDKTRSRRRRMALLRRELAPFAVAKDILLYSRDEVDQWRNSLNHVVGRALKEGRVLL